jgi:hypothetical protein
MNAPKWLAGLFAVLGVVFLGVGAAWMGNDLLRFGGLGLLMTGIVFLVVAVGMVALSGRLGQAKGARHALTRTGVRGQATVLGMRDTGISFRSGTEILVAFDLQVQLPGGTPYNVSMEQAVPRMLFGGVLPGSVLAVAVDPADPQEVAVDFSVAPRPAGTMPVVSAPGTGAVPGGAPPIGAVKSASDLLATGTRARATIVSAQDLGMTVAQTGKQPERPEWLDDRLYVFVLDIAVDGQPPFQAQFGHRVPDSRLHSLQPGTALTVAVDPANPTQSVAIDWGGQ